MSGQFVSTGRNDLRQRLLGETRQMRRVLADLHKHWDAPALNYLRDPLPQSELPENDPQSWEELRRAAIWLQDAAGRLVVFAQEQTLEAIDRRYDDDSR